jgi:hypothetical protein
MRSDAMVPTSYSLGFVTANCEVGVIGACGGDGGPHLASSLFSQAGDALEQLAVGVKLQNGKIHVEAGEVSACPRRL